MIPSSKLPCLSSWILFFNRLDKLSLQGSGPAVFQHPQQPARDAREEAVGLGQLWVPPRWAHRDLPAPGGTQGCSPGNSSWKGDVTIPEAFETPGLLTLSGTCMVANTAG